MALKRVLQWCSSVVLVFVIVVPASVRAQGPRAIPILDAKGEATGIEYTVAPTQLVRVNKDQVFPVNLVTKITVANNTKEQQRVIFCATGDSIVLDKDVNFKHMKVQMTLAPNQSFSCVVPHEQMLKARTDRLGAMGCRLIAIAAMGKSDATFSSGNDRTVPEFDKDGLPVAGKFNAVGKECGGIGPVQTGKVGDGIATCDGWGIIGGHPFRGDTNRGRILDLLDSLDLNIIVLQDPKLDLAVSKDQPRNDGQFFNCNKCFGMYTPDPDREKKTSLGQYAGYHLAPLAQDDRKKLAGKAIFANHWVTYKTQELIKEKSQTLSMNLYNDFTYFADTSTLVKYSIQQVYNSTGCSITALSIPPDTPFSIAPEETPQLLIEVTCDASIASTLQGYLTLTLTRADSDDEDILSQDFLRMASAPTN
jgi:hypothetical protein